MGIFFHQSVEGEGESLSPITTPFTKILHPALFSSLSWIPFFVFRIQKHVSLKSLID